jgi:predicted O-methyltransferase YrrM
MINLFAHVDHALGIIKDGWCSPEKAYQLAAIVAALRPIVTVEIGVFAGRSAFPMAIAHKVIGNGIVIGVDPYSVEAAVVGQEGDHKEWWQNSSDLDRIYKDILANIELFQLKDHLQLVRSKSDDYNPPKCIDLCHLDGNHSDQAIRDVDRFAPNVRVGGIMVCDDITWPGGGVLRAVERLQALGFVRLYPLDGGAVFQRVRS